MFSGLVAGLAEVSKIENFSKGSAKLHLKFSSDLFKGAGRTLPGLGDSVAVNGVCLSVTEIHEFENFFELAFDVSSETLARSNLGSLNIHDFVNVERPLRIGDEIGGHLVSGHVDATAILSMRQACGDYECFEFSLQGSARQRVAPYLVEKGSVALDGVSLTVNSVRDSGAITTFEVMLIPHTLSITRFAKLEVGSLVNIEADLAAKYLKRARDFEGASHV